MQKVLVGIRSKKIRKIMIIITIAITVYSALIKRYFLKLIHEVYEIAHHPTPLSHCVCVIYIYIV